MRLIPFWGNLHGPDSRTKTGWGVVTKPSHFSSEHCSIGVLSLLSPSLVLTFFGWNKVGSSRKSDEFGRVPSPLASFWLPSRSLPKSGNRGFQALGIFNRYKGEFSIGIDKFAKRCPDSFFGLPFGELLPRKPQERSAFPDGRICNLGEIAANAALSVAWLWQPWCVLGML